MGLPFVAVNKRATAALLSAIAIFMLLVPYLFLCTERVRQAAWTFAASSMCVMTVWMVLRGGIRSGAVPQLAMAVIAVVLLGRNAALILAGAALAADLGLAIFEASGGRLPVMFPGSPLSLWFSLLLLYLLTLPLVYRAIASLRESEERFGKAFRSNPEGISITTLREGRFVEVNDAFSRMLEYPRSDLIGNNSADLRIWADEQQRLALLQKLENSESVRGHEAQLRTRSARVRQVQISAEKVQLQGVDCILGITHDVSEQRTLELQLRQSHKMEALGHLAGGVAHDFNNLLMIIAGSAQILQERGGLADNVARHLRQIISTTDRAASLTRQLLAFTRQQVLEPRVLDLNEVISDLWKMLPHLIGADIETTLSLDPHLAKVSADSGQLEQVIMNLAVNARDAMPDGGRLTVKTTNVVLEDQESVRRGVAIPSGAYVLLTVSDTGMGIAQEIQARIFEPFFTTKEMGKGTGLGLATVYGVVKQSGGFIFVDSEVGAGTTFSVYLPAQTEAPATAILTTAHPAPGGRETVLLVEDQANIREITREYLRAKGYAVLEAGSGEEALEICRCANIRALVTDMMLPGLNGPDLAKAAWEIHPDLRVIYVSGYAEPNTLSAFGGARAAFFQKPFSLDALAQKLRTMLDQ